MYKYPEASHYNSVGASSSPGFLSDRKSEGLVENAEGRVFLFLPRSLPHLLSILLWFGKSYMDIVGNIHRKCERETTNIPIYKSVVQLFFFLFIYHT